MNFKMGIVIQVLPQVQCCVVGMFEFGAVENYDMVPYLSPVVSNPLDIWFGDMMNAPPFCPTDNKPVNADTAGSRVGNLFGSNPKEAMDDIDEKYYKPKGDGQASSKYRVDGFEFIPSPGSIAIVVYDNQDLPAFIIGFMSPTAASTMESFKKLSMNRFPDQQMPTLTDEHQVPNKDAYILEDSALDKVAFPEAYRDAKTMVDTSSDTGPAFSSHIYYRLGKIARHLKEVPKVFLEREATRLSTIYGIPLDRASDTPKVDGLSASRSEWESDINKKEGYKGNPTERGMFPETFIQIDKENRVTIASDVARSTADLSGDKIQGQKTNKDKGTYITIHKDFSEISCTSEDGIGFLGIRSKTLHQYAEGIYRLDVGINHGTNVNYPTTFNANNDPDIYQIRVGAWTEPGTIAFRSDLFAWKGRKAYLTGKERVSLTAGADSSGVYISAIPGRAPKVAIIAGMRYNLSTDSVDQVLKEIIDSANESPIGEIILSAETVRLNCVKLYYGDTEVSLKNHMQHAGIASTLASLSPVFSAAIEKLGQMIDTVSSMIKTMRPFRP